MAHEKEVELTKDGLTATVMSSSAKAYERLGWTRTDDGSSEGSSAPAESEPESEAPAKKTTTRKKAQ